jgi:hypothetical protein
MTKNFNALSQNSNIYNGKIAEIQTNQKLPSVVPGSLMTANKIQLEEFKRKVAHQNRISSQETKLEEQLNSDFGRLPPIQISFNSSQSVNRMSLSDLEDNFEKRPILSPKKKLEKLSKTNKKSLTKKLRINKKNTALAFGLTTALIIGGITLSNFSNTRIDYSDKIANAAENATKSELQKKTEAYSEWIKNKNNGDFLDANTDSDKDSLTNYEEFIIGSNPLSPFSCNEKITDSENLLNLINPATCRGIDLENSNDVKTFGDIVNLPLLQTQIGDKKSTVESKSTSSPSTNFEIIDTLES